MQTENNRTMTQDELVEDLQLLGYREASVTRIAAWRKLNLLPQFTRAGQGQGRGAGREKGQWSNPEDVLKQAVSIIELLKSYRRLENLYLPLWQLGYAIPPTRVRAALVQPLLTATKDFDVQEDGRSAIEDVIDQGVADVSQLFHGKLPLFDVPGNTMSALMNVTTNTNYDFSDQPYEDGVTELKEWEHSFFERCQKLLGDTIVINPEVIGDDNNIFANAPFINQYLSLPHLVAAIQNCSDEDLLRVQQDLQLGRDILELVKQLHELMAPYLPEAWRTIPDDVTVLFNFGTLAVWADLALRQQGFGPLLDGALPALLQALRDDFDETAAKEITAAGPEIEKALQAFEQLIVQQLAPDLR
jgi:hypothetical protein